MSKLSILDIQMAISTRQIKIWKIFFWKNIYRSIVSHVPSFQPFARSSSFFRAFFLHFYGTSFMNHPISSYSYCRFNIAPHFTRGIAILVISNTCKATLSHQHNYIHEANFLRRWFLTLSFAFWIARLISTSVPLWIFRDNLQSRNR